MTALMVAISPLASTTSLVSSTTLQEWHRRQDIELDQDGCVPDTLPGHGHQFSRRPILNPSLREADDQAQEDRLPGACSIHERQSRKSRLVLRTLQRIQGCSGLARPDFGCRTCPVRHPRQCRIARQLPHSCMCLWVAARSAFACIADDSG